MSVQQISKDRLRVTNAYYAKRYTNWTTPLRDFPMFSFRQMRFDDTYIGTGCIAVRRPAVKAQAAALSELLTYEAVEKLIKKKKISVLLAREWGAILQYANKTVPFNLISFGLKGKEENPPEPPIPESDTLSLLGLLLPTDEAACHFKLWYESGGDDMNFERDLLMPLLTYWSWYRKEYPDIRGIDFGCGSVTKGTAASLQLPFARNATGAGTDVRGLPEA